jgi:hypothetical protein
MVIITGETWKCPISPKTIAAGSDPHVPGAIGSRPRPKQDVSNLFKFIVAEGYRKAGVKSKTFNLDS